MQKIEMHVETFDDLTEIKVRCVGYADGKRVGVYAIFTNIDGFQRALETAQAWADGWNNG